MRRNRLMLHVLLAAGLSISAALVGHRLTAQTSPTAPAIATSAPKTAAQAPSQATQQQRLDRLCDELERQRQSLHIPGMAIAIVKDDKIILSRGFGLRDVERNLPATDNTLFAIGSSSKAFTVALIAMMVDQGKMAWDDLVSKYLPDFHLHDPEADAKITIRDLLCHRSGLTRTDLLWASGKASREQILQAIANAEPSEKFREKFQYQNIMYLAAGEAVAKAANADWDTLIAQRIFQPLDMKQTNTTLAAAQADPMLALGYQWNEDKKEFKHLPMRDLHNIAPAGAINSNVKDMAQWVRLQLNEGVIDGQSLIKAERFDEMRHKEIAVGEAAPGFDYGLGWMLHDWHGKKVVEHGGNIDGFAAQVTLVLKEHLGYVLLTNVSATPLQQMSINLVCDALLGEWKEHPDPPLDPSSVKDYLGKYHMDALKRDVTVLMKDGKLAVDVPGQMVFTLKPPAADAPEKKWTFEITDQIAVSFERDASGKVNILKFYQAGLIFECPKEGYTPPMEISLDAAQKYLGTYHGENPKMDATVLHRNGRLALDVPKQMIYDLRMPDDQGKWEFRATKDIAIKFEQDAAGTVTGLTMYQGGLEFKMPRIAGVESAKVPTLDEVLALHARGHGTDHLAALGPTRITAKLNMLNQGISGSVVTLCEGTGRYRQDTDLAPFGWIKTATDGKTGWAVSAFGPEQELKGKEAREVLLQHPLLVAGDWKKAFSKIEIARLDKLNDRDVVVVDLTGDDERCTAFINAQTGRTAKFVYNATVEGVGSIQATEVFDDYREVEGVWLPYRSTIDSALQGKNILQIDKVEPHITLPRDTFDKPADE